MTKVCKICLRDLPLECFYNDSSSKDGKYTYCKECQDKKYKIWYNSEKNKKKRYESHKKWVENNRERKNYLDAKRRAIKYKAVTETSDPDKIKKYYKEAKILTEVLGIPFSVDHVYPLIYGGKHHQANLRVIQQKENSSKNARIPTPEELHLAGKYRLPSFYLKVDL